MMRWWSQERQLAPKSQRVHPHASSCLGHGYIRAQTGAGSGPGQRLHHGPLAGLAGALLVDVHGALVRSPDGEVLPTEGDGDAEQTGLGGVRRGEALLVHERPRVAVDGEDAHKAGVQGADKQLLPGGAGHHDVAILGVEAWKWGVGWKCIGWS